MSMQWEGSMEHMQTCSREMMAKNDDGWMQKHVNCVVWLHLGKVVDRRERAHAAIGKGFFCYLWNVLSLFCQPSHRPSPAGGRPSLSLCVQTMMFIVYVDPGAKMSLDSNMEKSI